MRDRANFFTELLRGRKTTVAELKREIVESKSGLAHLKRTEAKGKAKGYATFCRSVENEWREVRAREEAIEAVTKKPIPKTPRPTMCPPPMVFKHYGKENPADEKYARENDPLDFLLPPDKRPAPTPKPAGYDERKRLAAEEYETFKARGFWGAGRRR